MEAVKYVGVLINSIKTPFPTSKLQCFPNQIFHVERITLINKFYNHFSTLSSMWILLEPKMFLI